MGAEEVRRIKEKYEPYLMRIEGVKGVGNTETHILVYMVKLTPQTAAFLPKELEGFPVRIIETKERIVPL